MNVDTGELRELQKGEKPKPNEVSLAVGEVVEVKGTPCRIVHINIGKKRISLQPIGKLAVTNENPSWPVDRR